MTSFKPFTLYPLSRASAAALSTVLRTTTLSYGNMRFSGIRPAETPQPIKMKFCKIDYVGELTRCAKNGCNRLAGGGPTHRWNITSIFVQYFTFFFSCMPLQPKRLNRFARTTSQTMRFAVRKCLLGGRVDTKLQFGVKTPKTSTFVTGMPNFQPNKYTRITFERYEIDEKCKQTTNTKSESENRTVTSFLL